MSMPSIQLIEQAPDHLTEVEDGQPQPHQVLDVVNASEINPESDPVAAASNNAVDVTASKNDAAHVAATSNDPGSNQKKSTTEVQFDWNEYDNKLKKVRSIALGTNIFYALNWFLGFCAVTWATTVILGGMVANIRKRDYYTVGLLLILEAIRLATARFFGFFVTRHLIHCSADPKKLVYNDCREFAAKEVLRTLGQVVELAVLSVSIVFPARRLRDVHYQLQDSCSSQDSTACNFNAVQNSLQIFYIIVLTNAVIAAIGIIYSKTIVYVHSDATSYALRRYYHSIVWNCIVKGLLHSTDLDLMKFAFDVQAEEYKNNKRAPDVMAMYRDLIFYLYEHPHHKGFEAAMVALDSENTFVREAAANIVGMWISSGISGGKTLMLQDDLLSKLADALGHQETGRAATSSFEQMAKKFPEQTAEVRNRNGGGDMLVDILIKRIHQVVVQGKPDKAIVFLKVLIHLIEKLEDIKKYSQYGSEKLKTHVTDLMKIVSKCKFKRTQVSATYVLVQLANKHTGVTDDEGVRTTLLALLKAKGEEKKKQAPSHQRKCTCCCGISLCWTKSGQHGEEKNVQAHHTASGEAQQTSSDNSGDAEKPWNCSCCWTKSAQKGDEKKDQAPSHQRKCTCCCGISLCWTKSGQHGEEKNAQAHHTASGEAQKTSPDSSGYAEKPWNCSCCWTKSPHKGDEKKEQVQSTTSGAAQRTSSKNSGESQKNSSETSGKAQKQWNCSFCKVISLFWTPFVLVPVTWVCSLIFISFFSLVRSQIKKFWDWLLIKLVGEDPDAGTKKGKPVDAPEHMLAYEVTYLKKVEEFVKKKYAEDKDLDNFKLNEDNIFDTWTHQVQVRVIKQAPDYKLPGWLEDIKTTTYNTAIVMVFLTLGLCSLFIFLPKFHF